MFSWKITKLCLHPSTTIKHLSSCNVTKYTLRAMLISFILEYFYTVGSHLEEDLGQNYFKTTNQNILFFIPNHFTWIILGIWSWKHMVANSDWTAHQGRGMSSNVCMPIMENWMCIMHLAFYILLWLWEKALLDFKHSASKHEILSIFQTNFWEQFELFAFFINNALTLNVGSSFQKKKKKSGIVHTAHCGKKSIC